MSVHDLAVHEARRAGPVVRVLVYMQLDICRRNRARRRERQAQRVESIREVAPLPAIPAALARAALRGAIVRV